VTWRRAVVLSAVSLFAVALSSCSTSAASSNAHTACRHIDLSLSTYKAASAPGVTATEEATLNAKAQAELLAALPYAASATSDDGSYNALMTTIQEADRVPEGLLVDSLSRQCQQILSKASYFGF
jgi:hypothetical protein